MTFSIAINLSTNAWNVIKFVVMYIMLDTLIPILLESIDKATILTNLSRHGRVPISKFTQDRHARSGLAKIVRLFRGSLENRPHTRKDYSVTIRPFLLATIWIASFIAEYDSGSQLNVKQVEIPVTPPSRETSLHAMFSCVQIERDTNPHLYQALVRYNTMTRQGLKCSCASPAEHGCTMPVQIERINVTPSNSLLNNAAPSLVFDSFTSPRTFSSDAPVQVTTHKNHVLVQARGSCDICSPSRTGPTDDIPYRVYASLDSDGILEKPAIYAARLEKGTLVGFASARAKSPTEKTETLDGLFVPSTAVSFLEGVWEYPNWEDRSAMTGDLARVLETINAGNDRSAEFSAIWTSWWLRGRMSYSNIGAQATLNISTSETATISLAGVLSFSYVIAVFLVLLVGVMYGYRMGFLETSGVGNVEWLISALIGQQHVGKASIKGVEDFQEFDLTVVEHVDGIHRVSAQHWIASLPLASPIDCDDIDGKALSGRR